MAKSLGTTISKGRFCSSKFPDKEYNIEVTRSSTKELVEFLFDNELMTSVFTEYKMVGNPEIYAHGDFGIYVEYRNIVNKSKFESLDNEVILKEELTDIGLHRLIEKSSADDSIYVKMGFIDKEIITTEIRTEEYNLSLECVQFGISKKITQRKGLEYLSKTEFYGKSTAHRISNLRSLTEISLEKNLDWLKGKNYTIVSDMDEIRKIVEFLNEFDAPIAFDTETTGLKIYNLEKDHPMRDKLVGLIFSWEDNQGIYIPIGHILFDNAPEDEVIELFRDIMETKHIVTHYGIFDAKVMKFYGINLNITDDTYLLQYLIDVRDAKKTKKLKELAERLLGIQQLELTDFFPKKGRRKVEIDFSYLPYDAVKAYGPADGDITRLLYKRLRPELLPAMEFIYGVEINLMKELANTEYEGIVIDMDRLKKYDDKFKEKKEELKKKIFEMAGEEFEIESNPQLTNILYNKFKYPILGKTKTGKPSVDKKVLKLLASVEDEKGREVYPLAGLLKTYKETSKLINAFTRKMFIENIDGMSYPRYNQAGAESGRISGYSPNLQQMSKEIRDLIVPRTNYYMVDIDYSQVEYRVMAALAKEEDVINDFSDPFADYHVLMASKMFGVPLDQVTGLQRFNGKTLNFGVSFGMGDYSLAQSLFKDSSPESVEKAAKKRHEYFEGVPNIRDMFINIKDFAELNGYVETYFCRRRYLPGIQSKDFRTKENNRRKAGNTRVQGTAADIMKIAFCRLAKLIRINGLDIKIVSTIHDELILEVNKKINPWQVIKMAREAMELVIPGFPPLYTGITLCRDWSDGKKDCLQLPVPLTDIRIEEVNNGTHNEPIVDVFHYMTEEIQWFCKEFIKDCIEVYNVDNNEVTIEMAREATKTHKAQTILKQFEELRAELEDKDEKFYKGKGLVMILKDIYGEVITEKELLEELADERREVVAGTIDDDELREIFADDEEYLDEEIDGFEEERVIINDIALARLKNKVEELEIIPEKEVATAANLYKKNSVVKVINNVCYIDINGITKTNLKKLSEYLKENSKYAGYEIILEMDGEMIKIEYKLQSIDRDLIEELVTSRVSKAI